MARHPDLEGFAKLLVLSCAVSAGIQAEAADPGTAALRTLTTAYEAHTLSKTEAVRGYPIHFAHATVNYYDPGLGALFLSDSTDAIFIDARGQTWRLLFRETTLRSRA